MKMAHPNLTFPDLTLPALSSSTFTSSLAGEPTLLVTMEPAMFFTPLIGLSVIDAGVGVIEVMDMGENAARDPYSASVAP